MAKYKHRSGQAFKESLGLLTVTKDPPELTEALIEVGELKKHIVVLEKALGKHRHQLSKALDTRHTLQVALFAVVPPHSYGDELDAPHPRPLATAQDSYAHAATSSRAAFETQALPLFETQTLDECALWRKSMVALDGFVKEQRQARETMDHYTAKVKALDYEKEKVEQHDKTSPKVEKLGTKLERNRNKLKVARGHYRIVTDAATHAATSISGPERGADALPIIGGLVRFETFAVSSAAAQSHIAQAEAALKEYKPPPKLTERLLRVHDEMMDAIFNENANPPTSSEQKEAEA